MRKRVTVTVEEELLNWVDKMTHEQLFRSRSHAVERALQVYKETYEKKGE